MTVLVGLSRRLSSSLLVVGGLASSGCLPTDDLTDYSEEWSAPVGGAGGSGTEQPTANGGLGGADPSPTDTPPSDGGPMLVDVDQGGVGGTPSSGDDAGLDAGATGVADAEPSALPDACADAAPGSCAG